MRVPARFDASALGLWVVAALVAAALALATAPSGTPDAPPAEPVWIELTPLDAGAAVAD